MGSRGSIDSSLHKPNKERKPKLIMHNTGDGGSHLIWTHPPPLPPKPLPRIDWLEAVLAVMMAEKPISNWLEPATAVMIGKPAKKPLTLAEKVFKISKKISSLEKYIVMSSYVKAQVKVLYPHKQGCFIRLNNEVDDKHVYFNILKTHENYNSLYSLALAASYNGNVIGVGTRKAIDPEIHNEVMYILAEWDR